MIDVAGPRLFDQVPRLHAAGIPFLERDPELDELTRLIAEAQTEHEATTSERIDEAHVLGQTNGLVERQHDHGRPQLDA